MGNEHSRNKPEGSRAPAPNKMVTAGGGGKATVNAHFAHAERTGVLNLCKANIKEIPPSIQQLAPKLRNIDFSFNKIVSLPSYVGQFAMLKQLHLNDNRLVTLPDEIGQLKKLETLSLQNNMLEDLPDTLVGLMGLKTIDLSGNQLAVLPAALCDMINLEVANLSLNIIEKMPPGDRLSRCKAFELNLNRNRLSTLSPFFAKCPRLRTLRVQENCLPVDEFTREILAESSLSLIEAEGNLFQDSELHQRDGYDEYTEKYAAIRRKMV